MDSASPSRNYPSPYSEDRVRRNVACINCRNSKVRCRASHVSGQPCQRCAKLELSCVVDKSHKRITKRSKLEQLEQELKSIKQAVNSAPKATTEAEPRPPRSPRATYSTYATDARPTLSQGQPPAPPPARDTPVSLSAGPTSASASVSAPENVARRPIKATQTRQRTLGSKTVDGSDINWYFDNYLEHFHPYIPVLRKRDPDECFEACPTLFWAVIYVASRRYSRDEDLFNLVTENLTRDIWALPGTPLIRLEEIHAMLLICSYPLPGTRLVTDPSTILANMSVTACMMLGLHTGRGGHGEFCIGSRQSVSCSDEEAASTWMVACILAQRCAVGIGHPPPSAIQTNDVAVRKALSSSQTDLLAMFDAQKYLNRMHTAMAAHIAAAGSVPESVVASWEDELEMLKPILAKHESDVTRIVALSAQMEVQTYYFLQSPDPPPITNPTSHPFPPVSVSVPTSTSPSPSVNALRTIRTAAKIISTILTPSPSPMLAHSPQWGLRSVIDAAALLTSALHSHIDPSVTENLLLLFSDADDSDDTPNTDPSLIVQRAHAAVMACSVRDMDLPARGAAIIEAFWTNRDRMTKSDCPARAWPNRLGAGMTFWCLSRFNQSLRQAKIQCKGLYRGPVPTCQLHLQRAHEGSRETPQPFQPPSQSNTPGASDPFQEVDWSLFLDDFGWGGDEPIFMGLS